MPVMFSVPLPAKAIGTTDTNWVTEKQLAAEKQIATRESKSRPHKQMAQKSNWEKFFSRGRKAYAQGWFEEAQDAFWEAMNACVGLPADDVRIALSHNNVGLVKQALGRLSDAEWHYHKALRCYKLCAGGDLAGIAKVLNNLATLYMQQGHADKAESVYRQLLDTYLIWLGDGHVLNAICEDNLASCLCQQGKLDDAEVHAQMALFAADKMVTPDWSIRANVFQTQAMILAMQQRFDEAEALLLEAMEIHRSRQSVGRYRLAVSLNNLGELYRRQGRLEEAQALCLESLNLRRQLLGNCHQSTFACLNNLGLIEHMKGQPEQARSFYEEALSVSLEGFGESHPNTALCMTNLGQLLMRLGEFDRAESNLQKALKIFVDRYSGKHPNIITTRSHLGRLYYEQQQFEDAADQYREAANLSEELLGSLHATTKLMQSSYESLTFILLQSAMKDVSEAVINYKNSQKEPRHKPGGEKK